jgi:hypothetical protein
VDVSWCDWTVRMGEKCVCAPRDPHTTSRSPFFCSVRDEAAKLQVAGQLRGQEFIMNQAKKVIVVLVLAFVGWALCAAIMWIGVTVTSVMNTLIVHAIGAPIVFALISLLCFRKLRYATPLQTAVVFGCIRHLDGFLCCRHPHPEKS